jgi:HlyD family type I secretion membrane fusion protein
VIQPGEEIMQIVPENAMEVEAQLNPKDAGNTQIGQNVTVKVSAYDYSRFGSIEGKLKSVSASTFLDENKRPYYKAFITLNQLYVGKNPNANKLSVGMTVQADIHTGQKTLLQYLIKPVYNAVKSSFTER